MASGENGGLRWGPVLALLVLGLIWGGNLASIKIGAKEIAPIFQAGLRSAIAALCLYAWMLFKGIPVFPGRKLTLHGLVLGLMFGGEFALLYVGLNHTLASRAYVLLYTAPFFVALGAHFFLKGDRLSLSKSLGLILAFSGVVALFSRDLGGASLGYLGGDLLALCAGCLWGATTIYLKRFLAAKIHPAQTLFFHLFFSTPILFGLSLVMEDKLAWGFSAPTIMAVLYQSVIIAFLSYLAWFMLVHRFPASLLHAFSFFTPVAGVFISGWLILGEPLSLRLLLSLALVSLGLLLVNRGPKHKEGPEAEQEDA
jgi:drug/metabolite transporter (DMT)-like permease